MPKTTLPTVPAATPAAATPTQATPMAQIIQARKIKHPLVFVRTHEEASTVSDIITHIMDAGLAKKIYSWDLRGIITDLTAREEANREIKMEDAALTSGILWYLKKPEFETRPGVKSDTLIPFLREENPNESVLSNVGPINDRSILIVKDFTHLVFPRPGAGHPHSANNIINRYLIENLSLLRRAWRMIIVLSHSPDIPPELAHLSQFVEFPLPEIGDLKRLVRTQATAKVNISSEAGRAPELTPEIRLTEALAEEVARELQGLTLGEAEDALRVANIINASRWQRGGRSEERMFDLGTLRENKANKLSRSSSLELMRPTDRLSEVGGMEDLKEKIKEIELKMHPDAKLVGLKQPRGFMFVGPGGTGKTLLARALASEWGLPTVSLNVANCKGSYVGQSEGNLREALERVEKLSPVILVLDEFEKMWAGSSTSGQTDSGVTAGMMSIFLPFLHKERESPIITIALSNNVQNLPAPLIRSGRFDGTIYIGLPGLKQRIEIFKIHFRKKTWNPDDLTLDWDKLAKASVGFSGAEVEQAVIQGITNKVRRSKYSRTDTPNMDDMMAAIASVVPSIRTHRAEYDSLKRWVEETGAIKASQEEDVGADYGLHKEKAGPIGEPVDEMNV